MAGSFGVLGAVLIALYCPLTARANGVPAQKTSRYEDVIEKGSATEWMADLIEDRENQNWLSVGNKYTLDASRFLLMEGESLPRTPGSQVKETEEFFGPKKIQKTHWISPMLVIKGTCYTAKDPNVEYHCTEVIVFKTPFLKNGELKASVDILVLKRRSSSHLNGNVPIDPEALSWIEEAEREHCAQSSATKRYFVPSTKILPIPSMGIKSFVDETLNAAIIGQKIRDSRIKQGVYELVAYTPPLLVYSGSSPDCDNTALETPQPCLKKQFLKTVLLEDSLRMQVAYFSTATNSIAKNDRRSKEEIDDFVWNYEATMNGFQTANLQKFLFEFCVTTISINGNHPALEPGKVEAVELAEEAYGMTPAYADSISLHVVDYTHPKLILKARRLTTYNTYQEQRAIIVDMNQKSEVLQVGSIMVTGRSTNS